MGPALEGWESGCSQENIPLKRLGLELVAPIPVPRDKLLKLLTSKLLSSRCMPSDEPDGVGVRVGVLEVPLVVAPSYCGMRGAPLVCKAAGKLAEDGTGDGV